MKDMYAYGSYAFVFGHPDDEMYAAAFIKSLVDASKKVSLIYVTSGNYLADDIAVRRKQEVIKAARLLGVGQNDLYTLDYPEKGFKDVFDKAREETERILQDLHIDCVVTHDFEGGHSVHDFTNLCSYLGSKREGADFWVFPSYHNQPGNRVWNRFIEQRDDDFTLGLNNVQAELKTKIFATHRTQRAFFEKLSPSDKDNMLKREVFRRIDRDVDYATKPTSPIGYDFEGSPTKFSEFLDVIERLKTK